ncbi:MAG: thermosome subunit [Euryarchaeota archaeon]|jgi:chaperonin GroEL (HSP60 family)|nr:thermosome subunit [Euryarchaeota archaeon]MBT5618185.1 thermosome subunit [Euryarchaeota archaeon]MBT5727168.1 thermosome subunit [Euryarchaeota archaeon]
MSDVPILKDTDRSTGRGALQKNIQAALALAGAVRSTLGPRGLDKLLIDDDGRTMVTNDGVTVLESAKVEHPVAKMIINASSVQDKIARDGTTSTVLICAEMLQNAWHLVTQGVHPATIARGFRMAEEHARSELNALSFASERSHQLLATKTCLTGKGHESMQALLAQLALDAAEAVLVSTERGPQADPTRVKILPQSGGTIGDSNLVTGLVLAKNRIHKDMPRHIKGGKILLIDGGIERRSMMGSVKLNVTSTGVLDAFRAKETELLEQQVTHLKSLGVDLLACKEGIDEDVRMMLTDAGIKAFRRVARSDLDLLARGCGATLVHDVKRASIADLGAFISSKNETWAGTVHWIVETEEGGATFIARGSTEAVLGEVERSFADALGVACQLVEDARLVAGGGATQVALARRLRRYAESIPGREQLGVEAFADALEVIPRVLAENAGLDPIDTLLNLVAAQSNAPSSSSDHIGLDVIHRKPENMLTQGVIEPLLIIDQGITGATEAAISVLRIDDVLWAKQDPVMADVPEME